MILYQDIEQIENLTDYKPLPSLKNAKIASLQELLDNLYSVQEQAHFIGDYFLLTAINGDIRKVELYIKLYSKRTGKEG